MALTRPSVELLPLEPLPEGGDPPGGLLAGGAPLGGLPLTATFDWARLAWELPVCVVVIIAVLAVVDPVDDVDVVDVHPVITAAMTKIIIVSIVKNFLFISISLCIMRIRPNRNNCHGLYPYILGSCLGKSSASRIRCYSSSLGICLLHIGVTRHLTNFSGEVSVFDWTAASVFS